MPRRSPVRQDRTALPLSAGAPTSLPERCCRFRYAPCLLPAVLLLAPVAAVAQHGGAPPPAQHPSAAHPAAAHPPAQNAPAAHTVPYTGPQFRSAAPQATPGEPRAPYQPQPGYAPAPGANRYSMPQPRSGPGFYGSEQHLGGWLQSHQGETFSSQANSLRQEKGFSNLPQPQQQRLIDRLHQLDAMPPQQRQRTLGRIENMERLTPERRQAVRNSAQELSALDPARRQQVRGAFRTLRDLPPGQREQMLSSPQFRSEYNPRERQILGNLLSVEPYQPQ